MDTRQRATWRIGGWIAVALLIVAAGTSRLPVRAIQVNAAHKSAAPLAMSIVRLAPVRPDAVVLPEIDAGDSSNQRAHLRRELVPVRTLRVPHSRPLRFLTAAAPSAGQSQLRI